MKKYCLAFGIALFVFTISSCSIKYQKLTFRGKPGTEIYSPDLKKLGDIQNDGTAKISINTEKYCPYLLYRRNDSQTFIPFALNYKTRKGNRVRRILGFPTLFITMIGWPSGDQGDYNYKYLKEQSTNDDFPFVPIVDNGIKKTALMQSDGESTLDSSSAEVASTTVVKRNSSTAKRKSIDFAKTISDTYVGSGSLLQKGNVVESYRSVKVVISRKDKNKVDVNVIESGESFFGSELEYTIRKTDDGYELVLNGIATAVISIDHNGKLSFTHPKVNIDGELYTLSINAEK